MPSDTSRSERTMRILMVAENISLRLSGETIVPWHYMLELLAAGHDLRVLCHVRVREHLRADLPPEIFARIAFAEDTRLQRCLSALERVLPHRMHDLIVNQLIAVLSQFRMRAIARTVIAEHAIDVVFQPAPIAAKAVSALFDLGCPVVIGPMSGGMDLPPGFRRLDGPAVRAAIAVARGASHLLHRLIPGKRRAAALIVANDRTRAALPATDGPRIHYLMESGVDLKRWPMRPARRDTAHADADPRVCFIFCGRFVDWKGIGYLVRAFAPLAREGGVRLDLVGDGELFAAVADQVADARLDGDVVLHGRLSVDDYIALLHETDVFVTPSLRECGGMAMMEAMAIGLPVIGVDWAGAAQYASPACALLVPPASEDALIAGLTRAMRTLRDDAALRAAMGLAARRHLEQQGLGWDTKAAEVLTILSQAVAEYRGESHALSSRAVPKRAPAPGTDQTLLGA